MHTNKCRLMTLISIGLFLSASISAQTFKTKDYYPLRGGNEWRYVAPPGWKEVDYVSRVVEDAGGFPEHYRNFENFERAEKIILLKEIERGDARAFRHYDATKAAKLLLLKKAGIFYVGEEFAGGESVVRFDNPILWFPAEFKIGEESAAETPFTRIYKTGKTERGTFKMTQKIAALETIKTAAGEFKKALRVESATFWDLGDGRRARSINIYHYAKKVGVVKASARFIVISAEGKETINRLVETDLKSYKLSSE